MNRQLWFLSFVVGCSISLLAAPSCVIAEEEECSKEVLLAYFPPVFVNETLNRFNVPKDQWEAINKTLSEKDSEIIKLVEAKGARMTPNPLKDPQQRQAVVKIFRETLFETFADVMKAHGVTENKQIQSMLDDIQQQKAKRFAQCIGKFAPAQKPAPVAPQENAPAPANPEEIPSSAEKEETEMQDKKD